MMCYVLWPLGNYLEEVKPWTDVAWSIDDDEIIFELEYCTCTILIIFLT